MGLPWQVHLRHDYLMASVLEVDIKQACHELRANGFTVIDNVLDAATTTAIRDRVLSQARAERAAKLDYVYQADAEGDFVNQWVYQLINKGEVLRQLPTHPVAAALVTSLLGAEYLLSSFDAHITYKGNMTMPLHADQWWMPPPQVPGQEFVRQGDISRNQVTTGDPTPSTEPITGPLVTNVMWMITEFTVDNGATRFVAKSHLSGQTPNADRTYDEVVAEGAAGSVVAWDGRTWHAAGLNVTDQPRVGITSYFCGPMVRQLTNLTYGLHSKVKAELDDDYLALLGFKPFSGYGMTDHPSCDVASSGDETAGVLE